MFLLGNLKNCKAKFLCLIATLCILFYFNNSLGAPPCHPRDHENYNLTNHGFANIIDGVVGIVSDQLLGKRKGANFTSIFTGSSNSSNVDFGDRFWNNGMIYKMFMSLTQNPNFQVIFYLCVILYVAFLGISFSVGTAGLSAKDMIQRFVKIGIIIFFTTPTGWEAYLELIVKNVLVSARYFNTAIIASMYNLPNEAIKNPFQPIDMVFSIVFHEVTWIKIASLIFSGSLLFTLLLLVVLVFVVLICLLVLIKVGILYTTTIVIATVLLCIGPLFFICLLFEKTRTYFTKWMQNLVGVFMQQYMLFLGFFIFCVIITNLIKGLFYFEVCYAPVITLSFTVKTPTVFINILDAVFTAVNWIPGVNLSAVKILPEYIINKKLPIFYYFMPIGATFDLPGDIFTGAALFIVTSIFNKFVDVVMGLGSEIADANETNAAKLAPKAALDKINKMQTDVSKYAGKFTAGIATGSGIVQGSHWMLQKRQAWQSKASDESDKSLTSRAGRFFARAGLKVTTPLGAAAGNVEKFYQSEATIQRNRATVENSKIVNETMKAEIKKLKDSGAITNENQLTDDHRKSIKSAVETELMKRGFTGEIDKNTNKATKFSDISKEKQDILMNDAFNRKVKMHGYNDLIGAAANRIPGLKQVKEFELSTKTAERDIDKVFRSVTPESRRQERINRSSGKVEKGIAEMINSLGKAKTTISNSPKEVVEQVKNLPQNMKKASAYTTKTFQNLRKQVKNLPQNMKKASAYTVKTFQNLGKQVKNKFSKKDDE
jgi:type IV secretory pathway VirB6-like protein